MKNVRLARPGLLFLLITALAWTTHAASFPFETTPPDQVIPAIDALVASKKASKSEITQLIRALEKPDTDIRVKERAAWALGQLNAAGAENALLKAATSKSLLVRSAAVNSLFHLRSKKTLAVMSDIALNDPILSLRQRAAVALGFLQSDQAIETLVRLAQDSREEIRGTAALAMAATQSKRNDFTSVLETLSDDESSFVQERAQKGLEVVRKKNEAVRLHLQSDESDIRLFAALYFREQGGKKDLPAVQDRAKVEKDEDVKPELDRAQAAIQKRVDAEKKKAAQAKAKAKAKADAAKSPHPKPSP